VRAKGLERAGVKEAGEENLSKTLKFRKKKPITAFQRKGFSSAITVF